MSAAKLQQRLLEASPWAGLYVSGDGQIHSGNMAAKQFFDLGAAGQAKLQGLIAKATTMEDAATVIQRLLRQASGMTEGVRTKLQLTDKTGRLHKCSLHLRMVEPGNARAPALLVCYLLPYEPREQGFHSLHEEVKTNLVQQRDRFIREQFAHRDILFAVIHDLKSPIVNISMLADIAEEQLGQDQDVAGCLDSLKLLQSSAAAAKKILGGLTEFYRLGLDISHPAEVDLKVLLQDIKTEVLSRHPHMSITLPDSAPILRTEEAILRSVLTNIMENAAKHHHRPQGQITVGVTLEHNEIILRIDDDGPGIAAELRDQVFAPFYSSATQPSTGMGLAICRRMVQHIGGRIELGSPQAGHGARFTIYWPAAAN
nr:HAMP domain-containing histidine kinase [Oceanococcus sp. HetDA_MAG_MS8]